MSTRLRGNVLPVLTVGTEDYAVDLTSWKIDNKDEVVVVTWSGKRQVRSSRFYLRGTAVNSTDAASFWRYVWDNAGATDVAYTVAPHGNASPTTAQPHLVGTLTIMRRPPIGSDADLSNTSASTFDFEFEIDGEPTLKVSA
ncbi:MAG: hypothetical protein QM677_02480 [Microbacterium sp.]